MYSHDSKKQCQTFKILTLNAAFVVRHFEDSNFEKVDRYFADLLSHHEFLRRRYKNQKGIPPRSSLSDSQWEWVKGNASEGPLKNREQLIRGGWHVHLLQELRTLEKMVQHA